MYVASLKFLYVVTLKRPELVAEVPFPKVPRRLPDILTGSEAGRLLSCITAIRYRTIAAVAYGAGLRITEVCTLRPADILWTNPCLDPRLHMGPCLLDHVDPRRCAARTELSQA